MAVDERDLDLLEMYLDQELSPHERAALEQRLRADSALREELRQLQNDRQLRRLVFAGYEPDEAAVGRITQRAHAAISRGEVWRCYLRRAGFATAAAAAVAIAFIGGW